MKTPVRLPRNDSGARPARSNSSQVTSSSSRCCGSMATASRGEMPNSAASKCPASGRKPPEAVYEVPGLSGSGCCSRSRSQPRSAGKSPIASPPAETNRHSSSGELMPPG
ncbi:hypothetical protein B0E53_05959 [Micromonospora sp. MH33]|nr:hypothetical protein B0E53_05959 [Micromonospora sp. MH33]